MAARIICGSYKVYDQLEKTGRSTTFLAQDTRTHQIVTLRILRSGEDASVVEQFNEEAEVLARLCENSYAPQLIRLYDHGSHAGMRYMALECVQGVTLRRILREKKRLGLDLAIQIARQIAHGLQHAHDCGVVHGALRPEYAILTDTGYVKISAFGVPQSDEPSRLARPGLPAANLSFYAAPEQLKPSGKGDNRSDLYSLGVIFYEMVAGRLPFSGTNGFMMMEAIEKNTPPPLVTNAAGISGDVERFVQTSLRKSPGERFGTASEFLRALDELSAHDPGSGSDHLPPGSAMIAAMALEREEEGLSRTEPQSAPMLLSQGDRAFPFPLGRPDIRVGRKDEQRGISPDVDLKPLPKSPTISRRHVRIRRRGDEWVVVRENGAKRALLNGRPLAYGDEEPLHHGDRLKLGAEELTFLLER